AARGWAPCAPGPGSARCRRPSCPRPAERTGPNARSGPCADRRRRRCARRRPGPTAAGRSPPRARPAPAGSRGWPRGSPGPNAPAPPVAAAAGPARRWLRPAPPAARARRHPAARRAARSASWRRPRPRPRSTPSPARAPARTGVVGVPAAPPGSVGCSPARPYPTGRVGARDPHIPGVRAYLTVFGVGVAGYFGWLDLPPALETTTSPWVLSVCGLLAAVEFFADKIPGVDSAWDLVNTLARMPAGAFLAAATLSPDGE